MCEVPGRAKCVTFHQNVFEYLRTPIMRSGEGGLNETYQPCPICPPELLWRRRHVFGTCTKSYIEGPAFSTGVDRRHAPSC